MANIKISDLSPAGTEAKKLWEELDEEQLKAVAGGIYRLVCYRIGNARGGVYEVCRQVYTGSISV